MSEATLSLAKRITEYLEDCSIVDLVEVGQLVFGESDADVLDIQNEENFRDRG